MQIKNLKLTSQTILVLICFVLKLVEFKSSIHKFQSPMHNLMRALLNADFIYLMKVLILLYVVYGRDS